jgi:ornithine cyclodeaminase/alanine dehydrogenase-like protein (mu-crystallin family)
MLYIGRKHMEEIVDLDTLMDCIEKAFQLYEEGAYQMPDRMHVDRPEGTILYMPCFTNEVSGTKIVSTFPENIKAGIPSIQGTMILNKSKTGETLAIMDGAMITAYRTGAVGGVGVRHTTRENCKRLGLVGTGVQGFFQVLYACAARPIEEVYIFDSDIARAQNFKSRLEMKLPSVSIHIVENVEELVKKSEIIITATPSTTPVLPDDEELLRGRHIIAIGSYKYEMRELPPALYRILDAVYIDTELAAEESGDLIVPVEKGWMQPEDYKVFGKVYRELEKMPKTQVRTTLYKSVGMALFDLLVAEAIYHSAVAKGLGVDLGE